MRAARPWSGSDAYGRGTEGTGAMAGGVRRAPEQILTLLVSASIRRSRLYVEALISFRSARVQPRARASPPRKCRFQMQSTCARLWAGKLGDAENRRRRRWTSGVQRAFALCSFTGSLTGLLSSSSQDDPLGATIGRKRPRSPERLTTEGGASTAVCSKRASENCAVHYRHRPRMAPGHGGGSDGATILGAAPGPCVILHPKRRAASGGPRA
ncbi:hypothetical protein C2E23DRAFT_285030 [Lenzites betulinus]|nr:hypothetical protein C2E23DRAFT_285030 [Lenzites betulinus]